MKFKCQLFLTFNGGNHYIYTLTEKLLINMDIFNKQKIYKNWNFFDKNFLSKIKTASSNMGTQSLN